MMMLDTSAHYGQSLGQQPFSQLSGQPFGQQMYGQPPFGQQQYGQPFGQLPFGQLHGQSFGQPPLGQLYGQPFGQPPFGQMYGQSFGQSVGGALPLALQSLCAQVGPLAALQIAAGLPQIGAPSLGSFGAPTLGGWPAPVGVPFGTPLGQQHGYPIGQGTWGWPGQPLLAGGPAAIGLLGLLAQMAFGNQGIPFGPRAIGSGFGVPGAGVAPVLAGSQPFAYTG